MEQYPLFQKKYFSSLQNALSYADPIWFFVRFMGSRGGKTVINEDIKNKKLKIKKQGVSLIFLLNEVILYKYKKILNDSEKNWIVAYKRPIDNVSFFTPTTGFPNPFDGDYTGPNDSRLPEVFETQLRSCNGEHLIEIYFDIKIPIIRSSATTKNTGYLHEWIIKPKK